MSKYNSRNSYRVVILLLFVFIRSMGYANVLVVEDFEDSSDAYIAWNGECERIDNPLINSDNNSAKVLKVTSCDYAPVGFPLNLPKDKSLSDYYRLRFQVAILDIPQGISLDWIGFNVGASENHSSMLLIDPNEGNGPAWINGELRKWYTVDLFFDENNLETALSSFTSDNINVMFKLGRKELSYIVDNIELIEVAKNDNDGFDNLNYMGVNLAGGDFGGVFPGVDGTHYGYPTYRDLDYFKSKKMKLIRLPFRWERIQYNMNGDLVTSEIAKIKTFMKAAEQRGMPVILDMHNFGRYSFDGGNSYQVIGESNNLTKEHLADVWKKLAKEFMNYTNLWGYDIMNEPYNMPSSNAWFEIAQATIYAIREVDINTPIVISGDGFSSSLNWVYFSDNLRHLIDPSNKLIFQAHTYFDHNQSGVYAHSYDNEGAHPNTGVDRIKPFADWLKKYDKKGLLGEYGIPDDDPRWLVVLENALKFLVENDIPGTYWAAGPRWGNYKLAVHPSNNYTVDRPQMAVLEKYTQTKSQSASHTPYVADLSDEYIGLNKLILIKPKFSKTITIYDIVGKIHCVLDLKENNETTVYIESGIYIIDGYKVVVK